MHLAVLAMLCLWVISIQRTAEQRLAGIEVELDHVKGEKDLISIKEIKRLILEELPEDVMALRIPRIDISNMESMLRAETRLYTVEAYVDAHQVLQIQAVQRRPILRVMNQHGDQYYVDQTGSYVQKSPRKASRVQ